MCGHKLLVQSAFNIPSWSPYDFNGHANLFIKYNYIINANMLLNIHAKLGFHNIWSLASRPQAWNPI